MSEDSITVLNLWISRVNAMAVDDLLALYDDDAVLLPTFSDVLLTDKEGIRAYFEKLVGQSGVKVTINQDSIIQQSFSDGLKSISGIYGWRFDQSMDPLVMKARFTFILDLARTSPIVHHHSSQLPQKS